MPETKGYILSEQDRLTLRDMVAEFVRRNLSSLRSAPLPEEPGCPEVYIVKPTETSGIPALTVAGESEEYDHPGRALCDIYYTVVIDEDTDDYELQPVGDTSYLLVWNISKSIVPQTWILAIKDKFGSWVAIMMDTPWYWGKLDEELAYNSVATVSLWNFKTSEDLGDDVEAYAPPVLTSGSIAAGKWVKVEYSALEDRWYVTATEC